MKNIRRIISITVILLLIFGIFVPQALAETDLPQNIEIEQVIEAELEDTESVAPSESAQATPSASQTQSAIDNLPEHTEQPDTASSQTNDITVNDAAAQPDITPSISPQPQPSTELNVSRTVEPESSESADITTEPDVTPSVSPQPATEPDISPAPDASSSAAPSPQSTEVTDAAAEERQKSPEELGYIPGELIAMLKSASDDPQTVAEELGCTGYETLLEASMTCAGEMGVYKIPVSQTVKSAIELFKNDPRVSFAEPNAVHPIEPPEESPRPFGMQFNDSVNLQWYLNDIKVPDAWNFIEGVPHQKVRVAVIDSGVDTTHEDLQKNLNKTLCVNGLSSDMPQETKDSGYHGTHVTGIICATTNNGIGVNGVATGPDNGGVEVISVRTSDNGTTISDDALVRGIGWARKHEAKVINMSLGGFSKNTAYEIAINGAVDDGITVIAAAGNEKTTALTYPADFANCISVIALDKNGNKADFSNYGSNKDISAPGVDIYSTVPGDYKYLNGTSMASPIVASVAAMMYSVNPNITPEQVRQTLRTTADDVGPIGFDIYTAYGKVNAFDAVKAAYRAGADVPAPDKPETPKNLRIAQQNQNSAKITWNAVSGAEGYELYRSVNNGQYLLLKDTGSENSFTDTALTTDDIYFYKVRAYKNKEADTKYGEFTVPVTFTLFDKTPPEPFEHVGIFRPGPAFAWPSKPGATGYEIARSTSSEYYPNSTVYFETEDTFFRDTTGVPLTTYHYKMRAYFEYGSEKIYTDYTNGHCMKFPDYGDYDASPNSDGTVTLDRYFGNSTTVVVPAEYHGKKVKGLGAVFAGMKNIEEVIVSEGIKQLDGNTFSGCESLKKVSLADSITFVGSNTFANCTALTDVKLPRCVYTLSDYAFYNCKSLKTFDATPLVQFQYIGQHTFDGCKSLTDVTFKDTVRLIEEYAFANCTALEKIMIPMTVSTFEDNVFHGCYNLKYAIFSSSTAPSGGSTLGSLSGFYRTVYYSGAKGFGSIWRNYKAVPIVSPPNKVYGLNAGEVTTKSVTLSWDFRYGSAGYELARSNNGDNYDTIATLSSESQTSYTDEGLSPDTDYYYRVRAYKIDNAINDGDKLYGDYSDPLYIKTPALPIPEPTASSSPSATATVSASPSTSPTVSASPSASATARPTPSAAPRPTPSPKPTVTVQPAPSQTTPRVPEPTASPIPAQTAKPSPAVSAKPTAVKLSNIASVKASNGGFDSANISWDAAQGATGYELERSSDNVNFSSVGLLRGTSYTDTGLTFGATYYYRVRPYRGSGSNKEYADYSPSASTTVSLSAGTALTAASTAYNKASITWESVKGATGYELQRSTDNVKFKKIYSSKRLSYTNSGLKIGTQYYYRVRAFRKAGRTTVYGEFSPVVTLKPSLGAVTGIKTRTSGKSAIKITWKRTGGASGYEVYRSTDNQSFVMVSTLSKSKSSYTDKNIIPNQTYYYKVRAYNTAGGVKTYGEHSNIVEYSITGN